eukprot:CAMPEP_0182914236 /NCGR_PEP_ID=MMETSP0034_2-20130328/38469_1 /TAXON_ID=156128 /ORGANISM="Nephroselmis pyriformis, Strain CCMP717" /LENGTH=268 /DNA_ID=CAMNT_0025051011 /DNA_START=215 /DNA_END=1019 /DNA_ORIENTATION=-
MGDDADASVSPMLRAGEEEAVFSEDEEVPDTPQRPPAVAAGGAGGAGRRKRKLEAKARFGTGPLADTPDGHPLNGGKKAVMVPGGGVPRGVPTITKKHASELRKLLGAEPQRPPAVAAGGAGGAGRRKRKLEAKARFGTGPLADTPDGHPLNGGKKARTRARAEAAGGERQPWEWSRRRLTWGSLRYVTRWYRTARIAQAVMVPGGGVPRGVPTITKKHASELRKLLGAENTASLERLERRAGIKPPKMPDRKFVSPQTRSDGGDKGG